MGPVRVVTDTTHYLPREMVKAHDLRQVSLYVRWDGRVEREADLPDFDGFYERLRTSGEMATTSQPSVGDFLEVYEPILEAGEDIVSVHLSGGISGTVRSAEQARDVLIERGIDPARLVVADSRTVAGGLGICLLGAIAAAEKGRSAEECAQTVHAVREGLKIWFAVDTLEFLRRGGRIGAAQAWVGAALKVKPILTLLDEVTPVERVRTSGRAFARLVECLRERREDGCDAFVVQHTQALERAQQLVDAGREIFGAEPLFVSEIGPVIGAHAGPGLLGVTAIPSRLLG
jgi:DegV family protein with EDD domain